MRRIFNIAIFVFFISCENGFSKYSPPDTCKTGVYLKALYNFNSSEYSYDVDLWMWFKYKKDTIHPLETTEIPNAKNYTFSHQSVEKKDSENWASQNCKATINQNWDLTHYPFDRQKLEVVLEQTEFDAKKVIMIAENPVFNYNDDIDIKGWKIDSAKVLNGVAKYNSDFGDPSLNRKEKSTYSKVYYTIFLSRNSWSLFFKLFTGCYVAFLVAFLVFFIPPSHADARLGLSIGGLFAAVGNKYVVDSNIPSSISFILIDKIHAITFVFILLTILFTIISLRLYNKNEGTKSNNISRFDRLSAKAVFFSYAVINFIMLCVAANS